MRQREHVFGSKDLASINDIPKAIATGAAKSRHTQPTNPAIR